MITMSAMNVVDTEMIISSTMKVNSSAIVRTVMCTKTGWRMMTDG